VAAFSSVLDVTTSGKSLDLTAPSMLTIANLNRGS
jgi:hypothetical protein